MKHDVVQSIVQVEPQILRKLVTEVKETVAADVDLAKHAKHNGAKNAVQTVNRNSFNVVKLWNIRRNGRKAGSYRRKTRIVTGIGY